MKNDKLHVLSVTSESGDDYGPFLFRKKPNDADLLTFLQGHTSECDAEQDDGPGWKGTHLHLSWSKQEVF